MPLSAYGYITQMDHTSNSLGYLFNIYGYPAIWDAHCIKQQYIDGNQNRFDGVWGRV